MKEKILELLKCKLQSTETVFEGLSPDLGLDFHINSKLRISVNSYIRRKKVKSGWFKRETVEYRTDHYLNTYEFLKQCWSTTFTSEITTEEFNEISELIKAKILLNEEAEAKRLLKVLDNELEICK